MNSTDATAVVQSAFQRSFGLMPRYETFSGGMILFIGETSCLQNNAFRGKIVVLGAAPAELLPCLGLRADKSLAPLAQQDNCPPAEGDLPFTESPAFIAHADHPLNAGLSPALRRRPFTRFDYTNEWNNLGFGRIRTDNSIWAATGGFVPDEQKNTTNRITELSAMHVGDAHGASAYAGAYLTLFDTPQASILWCARPVGPVDSTEWTVIERFVSDWRPDDMPCLPSLCQTPVGCRCLVTMRLDCDEAVGSARDLFACYREAQVPFSLAVKTSQYLDATDVALLNDVRASGGTLLSHTHTHQPNWGPGPAEALAEAEESYNWFRVLWPDMPLVDLAVSPFHTNPPYAVQALKQAGFTGFVSGIIHNDPEYLLGRAGVVPFAEGIVSISQQSMLHGDCYKRQHERVDVHIAAFEAQYVAGGIFGYLDHPFSERYQYDWDNAAQRRTAHQQLLRAMQGYEGVLFWGQQQCFDFVRALAAVRLRVQPEGTVMVEYAPQRTDLAYRYKGAIHPIKTA